MVSKKQIFLGQIRRTFRETPSHSNSNWYSKLFFCVCIHFIRKHLESLKRYSTILSPPSNDYDIDFILSSIIYVVSINIYIYYFTSKRITNQFSFEEILQALNKSLNFIFQCIYKISKHKSNHYTHYHYISIPRKMNSSISFFSSISQSY